VDPILRSVGFTLESRWPNTILLNRNSIVFGRLTPSPTVGHKRVVPQWMEENPYKATNQLEPGIIPPPFHSRGEEKAVAMWNRTPVLK